MSEYTAEMAHAAAARGAAWLDRRCPDWMREINQWSLDLRNPDFCILGQTAECLVPVGARDDEVNYVDVLEQFAPIAREKWARRYGFECPIFVSPPADIRYEILTIAWKELIRQRLEAHP